LDNYNNNELVGQECVEIYEYLEEIFICNVEGFLIIDFVDGANFFVCGDVLLQSGCEKGEKTKGSGDCVHYWCGWVLNLPRLSAVRMDSSRVSMALRRAGSGILNLASIIARKRENVKKMSLEYHTWMIHTNVLSTSWVQC